MPRLFYFLHDTLTTHIYPLSLHDALPIYQRHPVLHELRVAPFPQLRRAPGELRPIVDAGHFGLLRLDRDRAAPGDDVGEIVLALRIAPSEPAKRREQEPRIREINAGVHLGDLPLLEGGVLLLH